ncbi:MAG: DUF4147 domain-containing protein [Bdellovibrio sp.]|nr:DUF4147 domain-containing protein [Bdellovibrio sp.]
MQDALRAIYNCLAIRELLKKSCNFQADFSAQTKLFIVGLGKVACHHVQAISEVYQRVESKIAVVPKDFACVSDSILIRGAHPELESLSFQAARKLMNALQQIPHDGTLVFCLSGGGSALTEIPAPGLDEAFLQSVNSHLLRSGISIMEMNLIRMALSAFKNGGLLCSFAGQADIYLSVLSDIPTDDWSSVSSSPLLYREISTDQVRHVASRWLPEDWARKINRFLDTSEYQKLQETKRAAARRFKIKTELVADGKQALAYVAAQLPKRNIQNLGILSCSFEECIDIHIQCLKQMPLGPFALISGGECPVRITCQKPGMGGRNTHFTLALAEKIFYQNILNLSLQELGEWWIASLATDGRDGNCPCAGACFQRKMQTSIIPRQYLENFDSYSFFKKMPPEHQSLIHFEEYQSNLMDVRVICGVKNS